MKSSSFLLMALNSKGNYFRINCCYSHVASCPKTSVRVSSMGFREEAKNDPHWFG
jgi:hypothetical protein